MEGRVILVRRLVALDITLHGPKFIGIEFGIGTPAILLAGAYLAFRGPLLLGLYLLFTGINYVPALVYAIIIIRSGTARAEVAEEMVNDPHYVRKYSVQQLLIFVPLAIVILAAIQLRSCKD